MAQLARALADRQGWRWNDDEACAKRAKEPQHVAIQRDRKLALEEGIAELYGSQLHKSAFTRSAAAKVRAALGR